MKNRNYKLSPEQLNSILQLAKDTNTVPNPYKPQSQYATIVNALSQLGINSLHSIESLENKFLQLYTVKTLTTNWQKNLLTNTKTLMRKDYGKKLNQVNLKIISSKNKFGLFEV